MEYSYNNNRLPHPSSNDIEIKSLGNWLSTRKREQKKGKLD